MQNKYFLRAGDFRPERTTPENLRSVFGQYSSPRRSLEQLEADHNLFADEREANEASVAIRSFLASFSIICEERRRSALRTQKPSHNNVQRQGSDGPQIPEEGIRSRCGQPQVPNEENAPCPGDNNRCHATGSRVTIQIQSY